MTQQGFAVLKVGYVTQYKYAWAEQPDRTNISVEYPKCPACGVPVGRLYWLPPHEVILKQSRKVADFVAGASDLLVSERVLKLIEDGRFSGIEKIYPVTVLSMGRTPAAKARVIPKLFGCDIVHSRTRVDYGAMGVVWQERPKIDHCRVCGPGGGGSKGTVSRIARTVIEEGSWAGEDIFYPMNQPGAIIVTQQVADAIKDSGFTNVELEPCSQNF